MNAVMHPLATLDDAGRLERRVEAGQSVVFALGKQQLRYEKMMVKLGHEQQG